MIKKEPVLFAGIARAIVLGAAYFGFELSAEHLLEAYAAIELVLLPIVRTVVTPVKK